MLVKWQPVGGQNFSVKSEDLRCPTSDSAPIVGNGEFSRLSNPSEGLENENPGALAGATGADIPRITLCAEDYRMRAECATALAEAIGDCHPDDAVQLMTAALLDLTPDGPNCDFFLSAADEAAWWASVAAPAQLVAVLEATLNTLGDRVMHIKMRKRLFMSLWNAFSPADRERFLTYGKGNSNAH